MPERESPQVVRDRGTSVVATYLFCLALPTVVLLVYDVYTDADARRVPLFWLVGSAVVGAGLPFLCVSPYRGLGLVPLAATGWLAASLYGVWSGHWPGWANGLCLGTMAGALARGGRGEEPVEENYGLIAAVMVGAGIAWAFVVRERPFTLAGYAVLATAIGLAFWTWSRLLRPVVELALEPVFGAMYKIRGTGPGLANFPRTGPCLVIANHACWGDPFFLAKYIPRPVTPLMTARFFRPGVMTRFARLFGIIPVPETTFKKETPELREAIAALDRGECVVIFPEGYLRRTEDRPLRRFGQGVWQILKARPDTPVFACWVEGGWGSFTSYLNGPPTKNKKMDFRRPIAVGVSEAATVSPKVLADQMRTRIHLMNLVSAARAHLGLPPLPTFDLPAKGEAAADEGEA